MEFHVGERVPSSPRNLGWNPASSSEEGGSLNCGIHDLEHNTSSSSCEWSVVEPKTSDGRDDKYRDIRQLKRGAQSFPTPFDLTVNSSTQIRFRFKPHALSG